MPTSHLDQSQAIARTVIHRYSPAFHTLREAS